MAIERNICESKNRYTYIYISIIIHNYIYIGRERERERDTHAHAHTHILHIYNCIYVLHMHIRYVCLCRWVTSRIRGAGKNAKIWGILMVNLTINIAAPLGSYG